MRKPAVFLFDEPLSNLDAKLRVQMRAEISKLQQRLETTTVYVTHDQIEAMTMGHRIAVMNEGELQQVGTPLEVYEQPANLFVASFIGTPPMNFLPATLADGGADGRRLRLPAAGARRRSAPRRPGKDGKKVVAGPAAGEHPRGRPGTSRGGTVPSTAKVEFVEPLGHEVIVHGRVGDDLLVAKVDPHRAPEMGDDDRPGGRAGPLHLFDAATEKRLAA